MTLCCVYGCSSYSGKNVQFFSFPRKDKHPGTFKKWVSFCKRKNFVPSSGTRICSKHFRTEDMNQSDLLRKQLMPNENIRIRLNVDAAPTVRFDDEKITPKTVRRQLLRTSTPKKVKLQPSTSTNIICKNNCQKQNSEEFLINSNVENKNDKGIQCDMNNETNTDATESFDFPSDISSTDDESETTYGEDEEQLDYLSAKTHSLEKHPEIEHEFDIWHLTKSLMKRLKTLEKKHLDVFLWKSSINNHLWWSAQTCQGNGKILVENFLSVIHPISNEHEWETSGEIKRCEHEPISEKESNEKLWINPLSESFFALKKILTAKDFIKDLEQAKHFVHTAILDHNYNTGKNIIGDKMVFSKSLRKYTIKNTYERSKTDWRKQIMNKIEELSKENILEPMNISENVSVPQNIVLLPKPDLDEMR
ncbi:uncharacterized protein LOC112693733 [Sipha flava]|uniref:Uncharacterized protein LOC112693733 n=1 Tax=Sipha flava TaxID=143950 RepID=A0A8B8GNS5_9HEMI|nr:uncharacterized protein LOC112693733 [Sipha flava]